MSNFRTWFDEKSEEAKEQFLDGYPQLLLGGKQYTELFKLLSNYYFIEAKINHPLFGAQALIEDYDLLDTSEIRNNSRYAETVKALKLIQRALSRTTHIIFPDPKQLKGQLSARLTYFDLPEINQQLQKIKLPNTVLFDRAARGEYQQAIKKIQEGKTVTTEINGSTITIGGLFKLGASFAADGSLITSANNFSQIFARQPTSSVNIGLVKIKPGYKTDQVVAQLKAYLKDDVKVLTHQEFIELENNFWRSNSPIGFIFNLGVSMGFVVGVIIVYQVLSTDVNAHLREYATFKAIGYRHFYLLTIIFEEALILAALGFFPGLAVSLGLYQLTRTATNLPMYMTIIRGLQVLLLTIIMCAISGVIATNKLQSADPADMF
jgi:DevC protein